MSISRRSENSQTGCQPPKPEVFSVCAKGNVVDSLSSASKSSVVGDFFYLTAAGCCAKYERCLDVRNHRVGAQIDNREVKIC